MCTPSVCAASATFSVPITFVRSVSTWCDSHQSMLGLRGQKEGMRRSGEPTGVRVCIGGGSKANGPGLAGCLAQRTHRPVTPAASRMCVGLTRSISAKSASRFSRRASPSTTVLPCSLSMSMSLPPIHPFFP